MVGGPFSLKLGSPTTRRLVVALVLYALAGLAVLVAVPENSPLTLALTATLYVIAAGFSLAAMGGAYLRSKGLDRGLWGFLCGGIGLRVVGDLGWVAFANLELPLVEAAAYQLAWAGSFVALFVGILLFIARVSRSTALITALDTGAVMFSVGLLTYYLLVSPVISDGGGFDLWLREPSPDPQMPRRPAADAALLFLSLVVLSAKRKPPAAGFIAVAFGSFLVADGWLLRLYYTGAAYDLSHPLGAFWALGLILLGIAALSSGRSDSDTASSDTVSLRIPSGDGAASEAADETQPLWALAFWFGPLSPALLYSVALLWAVFERSVPSYLLIGGVLLMVYLAFRLSVLAYVNRTLTREKAEEARRIERARIAAELDEALERTVHAIPPMLDSYLEIRKTDPDAAEAALKQGITAAREASYRISYPVRELRAHSGDTALGPDYLVDQLIGEVEANFEIDVHPYIGASPEVLTAAELAGAYRVVSEAMWNAAKHSGARNIWVSTRWVGSVLLVKVRDDGHGFDEALVREGYGFALMRSRARDIGAALDIISKPPRGTPPRGTTVQLRFDLGHRIKQGYGS